MTEKYIYTDISDLGVLSFECPECKVKYHFDIFQKGNTLGRTKMNISLTKCRTCRVHFPREGHQQLMEILDNIQKTWETVRKRDYRIGFLLHRKD